MASFLSLTYRLNRGALPVPFLYHNSDIFCGGQGRERGEATFDKFALLGMCPLLSFCNTIDGTVHAGSEKYWVLYRKIAPWCWILFWALYRKMNGLRTKRFEFTVRCSSRPDITQSLPRCHLFFVVSGVEYRRKAGNKNGHITTWCWELYRNLNEAFVDITVKCT